MKVVARGGAVLCSFIDWFLLVFPSLLVACLVSLSCLVRVRIISNLALQLGTSLCY